MCGAFRRKFQRPLCSEEKNPGRAGYFGRLAETAEILCEGWLHTGDIGYRDDSRYFLISDRIKDMINVAVFKVLPSEVEEVLSGHPKVREVAIVKVPDEYDGEAVIVPQLQFQATEDKLLKYCNRKMAKYRVPKKIPFGVCLPRNDAGKVLRRVLGVELRCG
jgi:long-chain acyl-CoA synthetase